MSNSHSVLNFAFLRSGSDKTPSKSVRQCHPTGGRRRYVAKRCLIDVYSFRISVFSPFGCRSQAASRICRDSEHRNASELGSECKLSGLSNAVHGSALQKVRRSIVAV